MEKLIYQENGQGWFGNESQTWCEVSVLICYSPDYITAKTGCGGSIKVEKKIFLHFPKLVKPDYAGKINLRNGTKGQIKPKADWRTVDSTKKQINEFVLFAFLLFTANRSNLFVRFLGECTAHPN